MLGEAKPPYARLVKWASKYQFSCNEATTLLAVPPVSKNKRAYFVCFYYEFVHLVDNIPSLQRSLRTI